jgi:hypothetical protein
MVSVKKFALVRAADGWVWNTCRWDGETPWNHLPPGIDEIECPECVGPGWFYVDGDWQPPPPPEPQNEPLPDPPPEE